MSRAGIRLLFTLLEKSEHRMGQNQGGQLISDAYVSDSQHDGSKAAESRGVALAVAVNDPSGPVYTLPMLGSSAPIGGCLVRLAGAPALGVD